MFGKAALINAALPGIAICGLYYKHIAIINDDTSIVSKFEVSLTNDARDIIYDYRMFI